MSGSTHCYVGVAASLYFRHRVRFYLLLGLRPQHHPTSSSSRSKIPTEALVLARCSELGPCSWSLNSSWGGPRRDCCRGLASRAVACWAGPGFEASECGHGQVKVQGSGSDVTVKRSFYSFNPRLLSLPQASVLNH